MKETHPVASIERLKELGMDIAVYPSCSEFIQKNVTNVGKVTVQKGCPYWHGCEWRANTKHMQQQGPGDIHPRPRHIKTRFVKPNPDGVGDVVIDNYCGCWRWHQSLAKRNRKNRELARVIGGEGDTVTLRVGKKIVNPDNSIVFETDYKDTVIPPFPDPTKNKDLKNDVFAAKAKMEIEGADFREDELEEARRLGVKPEQSVLGDGATFTEMSVEDAKKIAGVG